MLCTPVLELLAIPVGQLKQMSFCSKMASHTFFSMSSRFLYLSPSQMDVSAMSVSPTTNESTSVMKCLCWDRCECFTRFDHKYYHSHTHLCITCDLTVFHLLFAVEPPSDLKFKILNENTVDMSWTRPSSTIEGFKIQVVSDAGQCGVSTSVYT